MSTQDERDALAQAIESSGYLPAHASDQVNLSNARGIADALIAAGWSRTPRPVTVSEEAIEAAARAIIETIDVLEFEDAEPEELADVARAALEAALPHLTIGQSEEAIEDAISNHLTEYLSWRGDADEGGEHWIECPVPELSRFIVESLPAVQVEADEFTPAMSHYLGQVIRERDAALSAIERVREALRVPHPMPKDRRSQDHYPKLVGDLLDLLPDPTERSNP